MIRDLDNMLRTLLVENLPEITEEDQVGFRPPDEDWRTAVTTLNKVALNLYLVDLRENRKLRSNAQVRVGEVDGQVIYEVAPARVDCHYLITAWSPAQAGPAVEPTLDEHHLLYQAMAALMNSAPLNPVRVYDGDSQQLATLPELFKTDLPTHVLPVEGFLKQPEFWGTMGQVHQWRPAIYLVVTLPLELVIPPAGPVVTTVSARMSRTDKPEAAEQLHKIGGRVLDARQPPPRPVGNVWVRLSTPDGRRVGVTYTDAEGRFTFHDLPAGTYTLEWGAQGLPIPPGPQAVTVPASNRDYELVFS